MDPVSGFYRKCNADTPGAEWAEGVGYHVFDEQARAEGQAAAKRIAVGCWREKLSEANRLKREAEEQLARLGEAPQPIGSDTCLDERAWQTMESAPKDGSPVDLWAVDLRNEEWSHRIPDAYWVTNRSVDIYGKNAGTRDGWCAPNYDYDGQDGWCDLNVAITHWRPVPARPKSGSDSDA